MGVSYISDQVCSVCNTTKRFNVLSEPILESNLEFLHLIKEANLILKGHHSCTEALGECGLVLDNMSFIK
ncbi:hypothetical protein GmHk_19G053679 [Glycine max]|nr:hypothetical protein GmHk_19G053679 [Glycine max]